MGISIELDPVEAHLVLGPIGDQAITERRLAAKLDGGAGEAASIRAEVLSRVATRIADALIPPCRWLGEEDCPRPATEGGFCRVHADHARKVRAILDETVAVPA